MPQTNSMNVGTSATKADIIQTFCCKAFISIAKIVVFISLQDWKGTMKEVFEKCRVMKENQTKPMDAWDQFAYKTETILGYMILLIFIFFFVIVMTNLLNALAIGDIEVRYNM